MEREYITLEKCRSVSCPFSKIVEENEEKKAILGIHYLNYYLNMKELDGTVS